MMYNMAAIPQADRNDFWLISFHIVTATAMNNLSSHIEKCSKSDNLSVIIISKCTLILLNQSIWMIRVSNIGKVWPIMKDLKVLDIITKISHFLPWIYVNAHAKSFTIAFISPVDLNYDEIRGTLRCDIMKLKKKKKTSVEKTIEIHKK